MRIIALFIIFLSSACVQGAEISSELRTTTISGETYQETYIKIVGIIETGDYDKFVSVLNATHGNKNKTIVSTISHGGDLIEAMKIGYLIRGLHLVTHTNVTPIGNNACDSACFFIYISGVMRWVQYLNIYPHEEYRSIGVHRPYFERKYFSGLTSTEAEKKYQELMGLSAEYLSKMNAPRAIIDKIFTIDSNKIYMLTPSDLEEKIGRYSPFYQEWVSSNCTPLTSSEMEDMYSIQSAMSLHDKKIKEMSNGYVQYLTSKYAESEKCKRNLIVNDQYKLLTRFLSRQS